MARADASLVDRLVSMLEEVNDVYGTVQQADADLIKVPAAGRLRHLHIFGSDVHKTCTLSKRNVLQS